MPSYSYTLGGGSGSGISGGSGATTVYGVVQVDHAALGLARLIKQYQGDRPRLQGALRAYLEALQSLEDVAMDVLVYRWPLTAEGEQLDVLGRIVDQARGEASDDVYRMLILVKILTNKSNGRVEELNHILDVIGGFDHLEIREVPPAFLEVYLAGTDYTTETVGALRSAKAGGVGMHVISSEAGWADVFRWSGTYATEEATSTYGWGSVHDATIPGGEWASCYAETP